MTKPATVRSAAAGGATFVGVGLVLALAGCSSPRGIPMDAKLVTEATVKSSFQAPADGLIWIYRSSGRGSRGQLHYSGVIGAGQVLVIDPAMNRATIDGQELEIVLPGGDVWYQAYFEPDQRVRKVIASRAPGRPTTTGTMIDETQNRGGPPVDGVPAHSTEQPKTNPVSGTE